MPDLGAGFLPDLKLLGSRLPTVQGGELGCLRRIIHTRVQVGPCGQGKQVHDVTVWGPDTNRGNQHHAAELLGTVGRHLGRNPTSQREADDIDGAEPHIPHRLCEKSKSWIAGPAAAKGKHGDGPVAIQITRGGQPFRWREVLL